MCARACVRLFQAILQPGVSGTRSHSFEVTRDKLAAIRDLEKNYNVLLNYVVVMLYSRIIILLCIIVS